MVDNVATVVKDIALSMEGQVAASSRNGPDVDHLIVEEEEEVFGGSELNKGEYLREVGKVRTAFIDVAMHEGVASIKHQSSLLIAIKETPTFDNNSPR